jgi:hypothetical protein
MKYRKYILLIKKGAIVLMALGLAACASTGNRHPDSVNGDQEDQDVLHQHDYDGREPASMRGDFTWLDEVEDNFSRIAAETSNRAVASQSKQEVLLKQKDWKFGYQPKSNHFYVDLQGVSYKMVQTTINDGERFAFAAEGQAENPLTLAVSQGEGRNVASGTVCETEISYWNRKTKSYVTEHKEVSGHPCERLLGLLKDYVP